MDLSWPPGAGHFYSRLDLHSQIDLLFENCAVVLAYALGHIGLTAAAALELFEI
jgi:hypothetical protein